MENNYHFKGVIKRVDYIQDITLDLNSNTAYTTVGAKQGDVDTRKINVHITKDGVKYTIPNNTTAQFRLRKPDGKAVVNSATITATDTVQITLTAQALAAPGRGYADVILRDANNTILSTVSFILIIMSAPDVAGQIASSNEFLYLQNVIDDADTTIKEAEAWAVGTRGGNPVTEYSFSTSGTVSGTNRTFTVNEEVFRNKVGIHPGFTLEHRFNYTTNWEYIDPTGLRFTNINLASYGITINGTGDFYNGNSFTVTVTDPDLQYHNNAKYWADSTINAKKSIEGLEISTTILPPDAEASVDKTFVDDVLVSFKPDHLTITVNPTTFVNKVKDMNEYTFQYNGQYWQRGNARVNLAEYGITVQGTPVANDFFKIYYGQHGNFNFNIPRGLTGDVYFMTFEIDPTTGFLNMFRPSAPHDVSQVGFEIVNSGIYEGYLAVTINTGG